jgi:tetratricopeptide (TPR) repeat protein
VEQFQPETLILYLGNNEWFRWFPVDEVPDPRRLGLLKFLARSRVLAYAEFRLINRQVERAHSHAGEFENHHQLIGYDYALEHPLAQPPADWEGVKRSFLANFETNLCDILQLAQQNRVRVILLTVPFCYRLSPAWMYPQPLAFTDGNAPVIRQSLDQAVAALRAGQPAQALEPLERALQREPAVPLLHYLKATALEAQGKLAEAEAAYATAREKTIGHLGSILSINATIRKVAAATATELIDVPPLFDRYEHNLGHYCNDDLIMDDCHPTPLGHRLIAEALLAQLSPRSGSGPAHLP